MAKDVAKSGGKNITGAQAAATMEKLRKLGATEISTGEREKISLDNEGDFIIAKLRGYTEGKGEKGLFKIYQLDGPSGQMWRMNGSFDLDSAIASGDYNGHWLMISLKEILPLSGARTLNVFTVLDIGLTLPAELQESDLPF